MSATKLEIADHLQACPRSIDELATLTQSHPDSLYRLLHMLAGFGIFEEIHLLIRTIGDKTEEIILNMNPVRTHVLAILGPQFEKIYANS